eukprot:gene2431-20478_t
MAAVAEMRLDESTEARSALSEVRNMQISFSTMVTCIRAWKEEEERRRVKLEEDRDRRNQSAVLSAETKSQELSHPMVL